MKNLSIVSYNMRFPCEADGENYFFNRLPLIKKTILQRMPDIIGAQEVTDESRAALIKELPEYTVVGAGRNADRHGETVAFLFRKDKFELAELSNRWLSDTPFTPGSRYENSDQSPCPRVLLTALFVPTDPEMKPFRVYNMHTDHVGAQARVRASEDLLAAIERDNAACPMPFIVLGDLNATPDAPEIALLSSESSPLKDVTDNLEITFHAWHARKGFTGSKIDYVFVSKDFEHKDTFLWTESDKGVYLSDHHPVEATLLL